MIAEITPIAQLYAMADKILGQVVGDFTEADWQVRDAAGHTPRWIMGHLAASRLRLVELMGMEPIPVAWMAVFGRGTSAADVPEHLDLRSVVQAFHDAHRRMAAHWEKLAPEQLAKPLGRTLPDGSDSIGGAIRFLAWHEAYHLGQLGMLRRLAGKPGLA